MHGIAEGDSVVLPLKGRSALAIGKVVGGYAHKPNNPEGAKHVRAVQWIATDIVRAGLDPLFLFLLLNKMELSSVQKSAETTQKRRSLFLAGQSKA